MSFNKSTSLFTAENFKPLCCWEPLPENNYPLHVTWPVDLETLLPSVEVSSNSPAGGGGWRGNNNRKHYRPEVIGLGGLKLLCQLSSPRMTGFISMRELFGVVTDIPSRKQHAVSCFRPGERWWRRGGARWFLQGHYGVLIPLSFHPLILNCWLPGWCLAEPQQVTFLTAHHCRCGPQIPLTSTGSPQENDLWGRNILVLMTVPHRTMKQLQLNKILMII